MELASKHIIKEAVLDFRFNGNTDGFSFQQEVKEWFDDFSGKLEELLNKNETTDEIISIDFLEVEVNVNGVDWKEEAATQISRKLQDELSLMRAGIIQRPGYVTKKQEQHFKELFLFYLKNGYFPWQHADVSSMDWENELQTLMTAADKKFVGQVKVLLTDSASAVHRFSQIIPFQSAVYLFSLLTKSPAETQQQFMNDLQLVMKFSSVNHLNRLKQFIYTAYLHQVTESLDLASTKHELLLLLKKKAQNSPQSQLVDRIQSFRFQSELFKEIQTELTGFIEEKIKRGRKPFADVRNQQQQHSVGIQPVIDETEAIFISDAGIVLVAAFLPALLDKTGLAANNKITDLSKAVCFVHFLATGTQKANEYELSLAKILCGVLPEQSIDVNSFHVTPLMRTEAEAVLSSVIEHWSILQNTSVAGLRDSFLKRKGKVTRKGNEWLLQVEQQSYDMLIQHIPWNYSLLKLPWMNWLLKTEWVY